MELLYHWQLELKQRVTDIQKNSKSAGMSKWAAKFAGGGSEQISGQSLAKHAKGNSCKHYVKALNEDPTNATLRSKLVATISDQLEDPAPEIQLEMMLQASVAQQLGAFNIDNIRIALKAEESYLKMLQGLCRFQGDNKKKHAIGLKKGGGSAAEIAILASESKTLIANCNTIGFYLEQKTELERLTQSRQRISIYKDMKTPPAEICFRGIYKLPAIEKLAFDKGGEWAEFCDNAAPLVEHMRFHSLLAPTACNFHQMFLKVKKQEVLGYLLKGRLEISQLMLSLAHFRGLGQPELQQKAKEGFKTAMHSYGAALKATGGSYDAHPGGIAALIEWSRFMLYFIDDLAPNLGMDLPRGWAGDNLERAKLMLKQSGSQDDEITQLLGVFGNRS
ncbi:MAG: hypothetical protein QNL04_05560 [SAR324 cluster bacterium]|nr:hypothetical protein [SAR324 cluster bacterium]